MNRLSTFWYWLLGLVFTDTPSTSFSLGEFEQQIVKPTPFDSTCSQRLAMLLQRYKPELLSRWRHVVLPASDKSKREEQEYQRLFNQKEEIEAELGSQKGSFESSLGEDSVINQNQTNNYQLGLSLGLSFMLFLGISEYVGVEIQSITPDKIHLALLSLAAAVCITLAQKIGIIKFVKATRSYEPKRSFHDDERHKNTIPFWQRIRQGDAAVWFSIAVVVFEMFFAAPGLISLLRPKQQAQFLFQLSVFVATGLAALVNVILAWGTALDEIRLAQERAERLIDPRQLEINERNRERRQSAEEAEAHLRVINERIKEQKLKVSNAEERSRLENQRWEFSVRKWERANPEKVEKFYEQYRQWQLDMQQEQASLNGGSKPQENSFLPKLEEPINKPNPPAQN